MAAKISLFLKIVIIFLFGLETLFAMLRNSIHKRFCEDTTSSAYVKGFKSDPMAIYKLLQYNCEARLDYWSRKFDLNIVMERLPDLKPQAISISQMTVACLSNTRGKLWMEVEVDMLRVQLSHMLSRYVLDGPQVTRGRYIAPEGTSYFYNNMYELDGKDWFQISTPYWCDTLVNILYRLPFTFRTIWDSRHLIRSCFDAMNMDKLDGGLYMMTGKFIFQSPFQEVSIGLTQKLQGEVIYDVIRHELCDVFNWRRLVDRDGWKKLDKWVRFRKLLVEFICGTYRIRYHPRYRVESEGTLLKSIHYQYPRRVWKGSELSHMHAITEVRNGIYRLGVFAKEVISFIYMDWIAIALKIMNLVRWKKILAARFVIARNLYLYMIRKREFRGKCFQTLQLCVFARLPEGVARTILSYVMIPHFVLGYQLAKLDRFRWDIWCGDIQTDRICMDITDMDTFYQPEEVCQRAPCMFDDSALTSRLVRPTLTRLHLQAIHFRRSNRLRYYALALKDAYMVGSELTCNSYFGTREEAAVMKQSDFESLFSAWAADMPLKIVFNRESIV